MNSLIHEQKLGLDIILEEPASPGKDQKFNVMFSK